MFPILEVIANYPTRIATSLASLAFASYYGYNRFYDHTTPDANPQLYGTPQNQDTIYIFSHGLADSYKQAFAFIKDTSQREPNAPIKPYVIDGPCVIFNYPDAQEIMARMLRVRFAKTSMGQKNEIETFAQAHEYAKQQGQKNMVFVGLSRGAAVIINYLADTHYDTSDVKAVVLESPFDSFDGVLGDIFAAHPWLAATVKTAAAYGIPFFKYHKAGKQPIDSAATVRKDLPILIVSSQEDGTVPATGTRRLYDKLRATGHHNTHLLRLEKGQHSKLLHADGNGDTYYTATHAFYARYGLPHDAAAAKKGQKHLGY